jgi:nicotinate-nucleotide pyrophosphorylase (carboxylating)
VSREFHQIQWDEQLEDDCRQIVRLAVREDLDRHYDWTSVALATPHLRGEVAVVVRRPGVIAGLRAVPVVLDEMEIEARWQPLIEDGQPVSSDQNRRSVSRRCAGSADRRASAAEHDRTAVGDRHADQPLRRRGSRHRARIYDTRKTTPGWRRLEKYAVRCGGGCNHRTGLFDAVLIKDNHWLCRASPGCGGTAGAGVPAQTLPDDEADRLIIEVEVDTLEQFESVLPAVPDIVLLDNMSADQLSRPSRAGTPRGCRSNWRHPAGSAWTRWPRSPRRASIGSALAP